MPQGGIEKKLIREVQKSLLLTEEDKKYWIQNAGALPEEVLKQVYGIIKTNDDLVQTYVVTAMKDNPSLLTELKTAIKKIKKDMLGAAEKEQQPEPEKELEEEIAKL